MFWPRWSYAANKVNIANQNSTIDEPEPKTHILESLSNILVTHIDFRRPILNYDEHNTTHDDTVDRVPESCIEEFNLFVSTWKGWQGPLPSIDDKIEWEKVERENSVYGRISCKREIKTNSENFDDSYGNISNETNFSTIIPTSSSLPTAESFR